MTFVYYPNQLSELKDVGGKGRNLQQLHQWSAPVAPFIIIGTESFKHWEKTQSIHSEVSRQLQQFLDSHHSIALRSSMIAEDQKDASFAGLFDTFLDVTQDNWQEKLIQIYRSVHSSRVLAYLEQKHLSIDLQMAVVAQKFIPSKKSGVLFTRSPMPPHSAVVIDAAHGLGEGVVSGTADVQHYKLNRLGEILDQPKELVLSKSETDELLVEALRLEKIYGAPSDIEWGWDDQLYIFQIRPITQVFEPLKVFADTNLSESYPGTVSPFTAAFVKRAYENVFTESALILGARGQRLITLKKHYAHLIAEVDHHLYYDLEHYYAVLRALPGGEKNIENWHKMIGGKIKAVAIPHHQTSLSALETLQGVFRLVEYAFKKKKRYAFFLDKLNQLASMIQADMRRLNSSQETIAYLGGLVERPLGFGLTVANDVFIMLGLGFLSGRLRKKGLPDEAVIDLLKTNGSLDSLKPLEAFENLTAELSSHFITAFQEVPMSEGVRPYEAAFEKLIKEGFEKEVNLVSDFLLRFGDRSFEELKLESLPLKNDPTLLKSFLKWGKKTKAGQFTTIKSTPPQLNWLDQKVLRFTKECIEFRETSRLWRGRFYHLLRTLVIDLADKLQQEDLSWQHFSLKDFFSITYHEWQDFALGKLTKDKIQNLMRTRLEWKTKYFHYPEFLVWQPDEKLPLQLPLRSESSLLRGQGVSPGIIEARALVLENPVEALAETDGDFILVTKNTDPAWVYIMSRSLGLISEKGSLLSHTAIIGRELGIPTVVGVRNATHELKTGDRIRINGSTGEVTLL